MIYGSVCSGIEAASVAWEPLGWQPAFFSEIDRFACSVLDHRFPAVPLHGDFRTIVAGQYANVDVLVGGTPCQDFSVAGLRAGLAGDRGALTIEFLHLAERLRPRWLVWENVPGVLSADEGRAFGAFLGLLGKLGYGFAYRVLDAQFFGVPQRRRRVFVVGCLGDWRRAAAVLFERESLSRNPPPSRKAGERIAPTVEARANAGGAGWGTDFLAGGGLVAHTQAGWLVAAAVANPIGAGDGRRSYDAQTNVVAHTLKADGFDAREDGTGRGVPLTICATGEITHTLTAFEGRGPVQEDGTGRGTPIIAFNPNRGQNSELCVSEDSFPAVTTSHAGQPAIAFSCKDDAADCGETSPTLRAMDNPHSAGNGGGQVAIAFATYNQSTHEISQTLRDPNGTFGDALPATFNGSAVRRLTPIECERLQGFPDDFTLVPYRKKPAADGPRYRALGNSMAVPCMKWIGGRIAMVDALE